MRLLPCRISGLCPWKQACLHRCGPNWASSWRKALVPCGSSLAPPLWPPASPAWQWQQAQRELQDLRCSSTSPGSDLRAPCRAGALPPDLLPSLSLFPSRSQATGAQAGKSTQNPLPAAGWCPSWGTAGDVPAAESNRAGAVALQGRRGGGCPRAAWLGQDKGWGNPGMLLANAVTGGTCTG